MQENGVTNPLPGDPASPSVDRGADNDYYFAGLYSTTIGSIVASYGDYVPVGLVTTNEEACERAFVSTTDDDLRYHFNLPATLQPTDLLSVTLSPLNLDTTDPVRARYGFEVYFNGVKVQSEILIRPAQTGQPYTTPQFSVASVNAQVGPGYDNIVSLKGINYNNDGGGNWMGMDYVQLNPPSPPIPAPMIPWTVGLADNNWPCAAATPCTGGGATANFVQESAAVSPLPGSPTSPSTDRQADNDYYFGGLYTTTIPSVVTAYGAYTPVGLVAANEEAVERAFSGGGTEERYHFNLPNTLPPNQLVSISFAALNLDETDPVNAHYGVEVYFNGVKVQTEIAIRPPQLRQTFSTVPFTLGSVNAGMGSGFDNIITLKGIPYAADGGGNWMGIDYISMDLATNTIPPSVLPWTVGMNDDAWALGHGGGSNTTFVWGDGTVNPLPGSPVTTDLFDGLSDNDYYFAGSYTTVIAGNGSYTPVGAVYVNEDGAEGALAEGAAFGLENELRYHFNLPTTLSADALLSVSFDALALDNTALDPQYGVEVYFNNVLVQSEIIIRPAECAFCANRVGMTITTPQFSPASVNAQVGPGYDNIITLKGISHAAEGGGDYVQLDFVGLDPHAQIAFPWACGKNDNTHNRSGTGGGANANFWQENGNINALPGSPNSPQTDQQSDNDYYFAGVYTNTLPGVVSKYGDYTPVGTVLANEGGAERAFAGADNDLRYHFNLPDSLKPDDLLSITFDELDLDGSVADPHYGVEVYFNGVLVKSETIIHWAQTGQALSTQPFTLASVDARVGLGYDNIVSLKGINYNADGGGAWMGLDYIQLNAVHASPFPWTVGQADNGWPCNAGSPCTGGGAYANFVQENGRIDPLPGNAGNRVADGQSDNDYYFSGNYTTTIPSVVASYGPYTPVGEVPVNELGTERAFAGGGNDLRYHFNLPSTLKPDDEVQVSFSAISLDETSCCGNPIPTDPRYGVEVYFNGVLVQTNMVIRPAQLRMNNTTPAFTLASVNAQVGPGYDNIVSLKGVNYSADGGGAWMGFDYVQLNSVPLQFLIPTLVGDQVVLKWTGKGALQKAPALNANPSLIQWQDVTPVPTSPYSEAIVPGASRFYRLKQQ